MPELRFPDHLRAIDHINYRTRRILRRRAVTGDDGTKHALWRFCSGDPSTMRPHMKPVLSFSFFGVLLSMLPALAASDPDLASFRAAYTTGDGLAYVIVNDEKGEHLYRYGDASRLAAKKDERAYMLFTCLSPHVFVAEKTEDKSVLSKAKVVKQSDPEFSTLDTKYVATCKNPFVKSALPK